MILNQRGSEQYQVQCSANYAFITTSSNVLRDKDGEHEAVCASVVAGCDPPPVLDPAKGVRDFESQTIKAFVGVVVELAVLARSVQPGTSRCHGLCPRGIFDAWMG
jgi:hypothetical protein